MKTLTVIAFLLASVAPAQPRRVAAPGGASIQQTTDIINDCEKRTNKFRKTLDKALGKDNVRAGQAREDQLNNDANRLENQLDKVGDSWNKNHSIDQTRQHVALATNIGSDINKAMRTWKMGGDAESEWAALRSELNRLASTFGTPGIR
jgi:hypothetical protein